MSHTQGNSQNGSCLKVFYRPEDQSDFSELHLMARTLSQLHKCFTSVANDEFPTGVVSTKQFSSVR